MSRNKASCNVGNNLWNWKTFHCYNVSPIGSRMGDDQYRNWGGRTALGTLSWNQMMVKFQLQPCEQYGSSIRSSAAGRYAWSGKSHLLCSPLLSCPTLHLLFHPSAWGHHSSITFLQSVCLKTLNLRPTFTSRRALPPDQKWCLQKLTFCHHSVQNARHKRSPRLIAKRSTTSCDFRPSPETRHGMTKQERRQAGLCSVIFCVLYDKSVTVK